MKYQLPCSCGKSIAIEVSQAGQLVHCSCGTQLEVPAMRLIRQLKPAGADVQVRTKPVRRWSVAARVLFTLGLAVAVFGLSRAAYFQLGRSSLDTQEVAWDRTLDSDIAKLANMNLEEAWKNWELVRDSGIGPYQPPPFIVSRLVSTYLKNFVLAWIGIALGGLVAVGVALLLPRKVVASPDRRAPDSRARRT